jgi:peptide/nickel transport system substrate-binding protein
VSAGLLIAGCKAHRPNDQPSSIAELRVAFAGANTPDSGVGLNQFSSFFSLEGLTYSGIDGRPSPRLSQSWQWEQDGHALHVSLRPNVIFHDGTPLTSTVAVDILRKAIALASNRASYPSLEDITSIEPTGDLGLRINLSRRSAFLPEDLSLPFEHGASGVGTGPYRLVDRGNGSLVFERFPRYYLGAPSISKVVVTTFSTLRPAWASLLRGTVDVVSDIPADAVEFVRTDDVQVISFARGYQYLIAFNSQRKPFTSPVVRRALNLAIDRNELVRNSLGGAALPATGPLWPKHWAYDNSIQSYPFDPGLATSTLEDAGFHLQHSAASNGPPARLKFTCLVPAGYSVLERVGLDVQKQLYDIGVDMQFQVLPVAEYGDRIRRGDFDVVLTDLSSGPTFGRPYTFWRSAKTSKGLNVFGYENAESEELFQVLRTSMNEAAVRSATRRLQRVLLDDPPALFLAWSERTRAVRRDFSVFAEAGADPLLTLWRWTPSSDARAALTQ